jgi:hypothetical protein
MIALSPRHFVNRGSVLASGFIIPWGIMGVNRARDRVLDLWQPGLRLKKTDCAFIVLLPAPVRVIAEQAIGDPLVRHERWLIALPLKEVANLSLPSDSVVFAKTGRIQSIPLTGLADEDITQWIDTEFAGVATVISLGAPPEELAFQAPEFDSRNMQGVPPASTELQGLLAELRQPHLWEGAGRGEPGVDRGLVSLGGALKRLLLYVRGLSFRRKPSSRTGTKVLENRTREADKRSPVWLWIERNTNRFLNLSRFSRLLGLRHARYLARMVAMMQSGDIDEGLRHAIPLADATKIANRKWSWFGVPRRRSSLSIDPLRASAQSTWALDGQFYTYLRNLYRQAFQRLEAQGRVEEAAFVLTELLASHAEAVSFLERHGRLRLAAEIAEARKLSPAMVIRLWWLAKEPKRAMVLAIRTGEFEGAINHLSGSHPEEADKLRVFWAERLALSGKYVAAAEAIWPVKQGRRLASRWFTQAIELGGTAGGIAMARKAARFPESLSDVFAQIENLLADETAESARGRRAFAESLRQEARTPESKALARLAVRSVVRDVQQGIVEFTPAQLRHLLDYAGDACLRADVPPVQALKPNPESVVPAAVVEIAAHDVGSHFVTDLTLLPDGRLLLALGEAGLLFLSPDGKAITQLNQPVHKLVVSDDGSRAIGIAPRDSVSRLVRIDVVARTASYWCDTTISAYTDNFDGSVWCVANGEDVFLIDTLAQGFEALWRIPDLGGNVRAMQRNRKEHRLFVVTENPKQLILWTFDQPSCTLRSKQEFNAELSQIPPLAPHAISQTVLVRQAVAISEAGDICEQFTARSPDQDHDPTMVCQITTHPSAGGRQTHRSGMMSGSLRHASSQDFWMAIPVWQENNIEVFLLDTRSGTGQLRFRMQGAKQIALRFAESVLLCADDQGRVLALNVRTNKSTRDLRI